MAVHVMSPQFGRVDKADSNYAGSPDSIPGSGRIKRQLVLATRQDRLLNGFINRGSLYHCILWVSNIFL